MITKFLGIILHCLTFLLLIQGNLVFSKNEISEILTLKDTSAIPIEIYAKYSTNEIAELLVKRLHLRKEQGLDTGFDYRNNTEIYLAFNSAHTDKIVEDGHFRNAHQTSQGATFNDDLSHRAMLEDELIGLKLDGKQNKELESKINRIRPKYAYLMPKGFPNYPQTTLTPGYGNIFAKIKNSIKKRATFTIGDSMEKGRGTVHTFGYKGNIRLKEKIHKIPYWEAQIWGDLPISEVEYFLVNCEGFPIVSENQVKLMLAKSLDVYFCKIGPHSQSISPLKKVTKNDLGKGHFLQQDDREFPEIQNFQHYQKKENLIVKFLAKDGLGLNFCQIKAYSNNVILFDDEIPFSKINITSTTCEFEIEKFKLPAKIQIFVKDWYGNQTSLEKIITK